MDVLKTGMWMVPLLIVLVLFIADASSAAPITGDCTHATAEQVAGHLDPFTVGVSDPINQVLCGAFTGPGSDAMAVALSAPTCWGAQEWLVFTFTNGVWTEVLDRHEFIFPLVGAGDDIRVTTPVFAIGDPRCVPSGGKSTRLWHWNGTQFVAGPATITRPRIVHRASFQTPDHTTACNLVDEDTAYCATGNRPHVATLDSSGRVNICRGRNCLGPTHTVHTRGLPVLEYGQSDVVGLHICRSAKTGLRCTMTHRRRGFRISAAAVSKIG